MGALFHCWRRETRQLVKRGEDGAVEEDSLNIEEARGRMIAEGY
jgi:hypothetical protein